MSVFSREFFQAPFTIEDALKRVLSAEKKHPRDLCLLPRDCGMPFGMLISSRLIQLSQMEDELNDIEIIWLERFRQYAMKHCGNLAVLNSYVDFQKYAKNNRPDPTRGEWIWLYSQIAEHPNLDLFRNLVQIMACRDALLPFLESIPDRDFSNAYHRIMSPWLSINPVPAIPYQGLEAAIQEDAPSKVAITKISCRRVTDAEILNRAIALEKGAVVSSMLKTASVKRIVKILIEAHASWENPIPLFERLLPQHEDEIAAWRDPWGNVFFWYLYRRPVLSQTIIEGLPPKVLATFETKNIYGISPEDLWSFHRPSSVSPESR